MKIRFKSSCVFHGDRAAGEIADFAALPPDACIVVGAGLAEILEDEPEQPEQPAPEPGMDALENMDAASAETEDEPEPEPAAKPAKRSAKRKR